MPKYLWVLFATALSLGAQSTSQQSQDQRPGAVEGFITNQLSGEPLRRVEVHILPFNDDSQSQPQGPVGFGPGGIGGRLGSSRGARAVATDGTGKFRFENVAPGNYRITYQRSGFMLPRQTGSAARTMSVRVGPGETVTNLRYSLMPQAVLSGRVVDEEGEPLQGVSVRVTSATPSRGRREFRGMRSNATDDRGQFRIPEIAPGKVLLAFESRSFMGESVPLEQAGGGPALGYATTFYPGTIDASQAQPLDVKAGMEISNLDVTLRRVPVFKIKGRAIDEDGKPIQRFMASAVSVTYPQASSVGISAGAQPDGRFEITNVPPGDYLVFIRSMGRGGGPGGPGGPGGQGGPGSASSGSARVSVGSRDLDGLVVQLNPGFTVSGKVSVEGTATGINITNIRFTLDPAETVIFGPARPVRAGADGSFTTNGLQPGVYSLNIVTPPQGAYLSSVRINNQDYFGKDLDFTNGPPGPIQVVFRTDGASVSGTVDSTVTRDSTSDWMAVLLPAEPTLRGAISPRTAKIGSNGSFEMRDLRPGEYLLWLFDSYDSSEIDNPDFVRGVESSAIKVKAVAGQTANPQVKVTPWPSAY